jgi:thymidylate kinase
MKKFIDKKKRGLFIVFEGVDRVGKSTQVEMLKNYFINKKLEDCEKLNFPGKILFIYTLC